MSLMAKVRAWWHSLPRLVWDTCDAPIVDADRRYAYTMQWLGPALISRDQKILARLSRPRPVIWRYTLDQQGASRGCAERVFRLPITTDDSARERAQ